MFFEIASSLVVGSFVGYTYLLKNGSTDEGKRIVRICENAGLTVKGESMRILRRSRREWGIEYAYKIPLGKSLTDYEAKIDAIRDGLNAKGNVDIRKLLEALKRRDFKAVANELNGKKVRKDVELDYDGVLRVRVYEKEIPARFDFDKELLGKLRGWQVPVGMTRDKLVTHDFDKYEHLIVAGMTRYGKSVFLKNIITTLVAQQTKHVKLFLVDLKGGLAFNRFKSLEQVEGLAKNPEEALEILTGAQSKMSATIDYLLKNGYEDVKEAGIKERFFVIIDEAADVSDCKDCQAFIKDITRRGAGAGFRMIYTTQYPTNETLSPQVRQNCSARLCFRLNTEVASRAVLDEGGAEKLPIGLHGRAIYRTDRKQIVQTPYIENKFIEETLNLNITINGRKDGEDNAFGNRTERAAPRKHTLELEEVGLS